MGQPRSASAGRGRARGGAQCTHDGLRGEPGRDLRVGRGSGPEGRRPPGHVSLLLAAAKRSRKLAGPFRRHLAPWREALSLLRGRPPAADPSWANPASGATLPLHSLPSRHGVRGPELNAARKAGRGQGRTPALLPSGSEAFSSPATKRPAFRTKETSRCLRSRPGTLAWKSRLASASLRAQGQPCSAPRYETNPVRVTARRTSRNGDAAAACLGPDGNPAVGDARGRPGTKRGFPGSPRSTDSVVPAGSASRFVSREGPKRVCLSPTRGETRRWSTLRHRLRPFKGFRVSRAVSTRPGKLDSSVPVS